MGLILRSQVSSYFQICRLCSGLIPDIEAGPFPDGREIYGALGDGCHDFDISTFHFRSLVCLSSSVGKGIIPCWRLLPDMRTYAKKHTSMLVNNRLIQTHVSKHEGRDRFQAGN